MLRGIAQSGMIYSRATQASLISLSERDEERFLGANEHTSLKAIQ